MNNVTIEETQGRIPGPYMEKDMPAHPEDIVMSLSGFDVLMMRFECAMLEMTTKLEILNEELKMVSDDSPITSIRSRLKKPRSIYEKLMRQGNEISLRSIEENLNDVAGIRIICAFVDDIYRVVDMIFQQDDINVIEIKDYISNPKPNGYRSYHIIVEIPVFFSNAKRCMRVEIQIRTVAMDFWASQEQRIRYKKNLPPEKADEIAEDLKSCADTIAEMDMKMRAIRDKLG